MNDQLISFPTAKLAKEKGFDILQNVYYDLTKESLTSYSPRTQYAPDELRRFGYLAPTQSLLQKWLKEKHKINIFLSSNSMFKYHHQIANLNTGEEWWSLEWQDTYEDALESGLQEALKLIKTD